MSWLRTTLCEDLADLERRRGRVPDTKAIERVIDEDIRRWSAENRERKFQYAPKVEKKPLDEQHDAAKRAAREKGLEFKAKAAQDEIVNRTCQCGGICRHCKLRARLLVLLESLPMQERTPKAPAWQNCRRPEWARQVIGVWSWMTFHPNAKLLKKKGELERVVVRKLEDIADRSNAIIGLGQWDA